MTATNEDKCILRHVCKSAGNPEACSDLCASFIALHGRSGKGGRVSAANIPKQYAHITLKTSPVRESQPVIYAALDDYVKTFSRQFDEGGEQIKGVYLYSPTTGNGKTTTAIALANEWIIRHYVGSIKRGLSPSLQPAYFLDVNAWQSTFNEFNRPNVPAYIAEPAAAEYYQALKVAMEVPLLVMDDLGVRTATEAFRHDLHKIINHRNVQELPTIYTSNVQVKELATVFNDPRLPDRVRDMCEVLTFKGESKRGRRK